MSPSKASRIATQALGGVAVIVGGSILLAVEIPCCAIALVGKLTTVGLRLVAPKNKKLRVLERDFTNLPFTMASAFIPDGMP